MNFWSQSNLGWQPQPAEIKHEEVAIIQTFTDGVLKSGVVIAELFTAHTPSATHCTRLCLNLSDNRSDWKVTTALQKVHFQKHTLPPHRKAINEHHASCLAPPPTTGTLSWASRLTKRAACRGLSRRRPARRTRTYEHTGLLTPFSSWRAYRQK